jgi:hypothetical protein
MNYHRGCLPQRCATSTAMRPCSFFGLSSPYIPLRKNRILPNLNQTQKSGVAGKADSPDDVIDVAESKGCLSEEKESATPNDQAGKHKEDNLILSSIPGAEKGGKKLVLIYTCAVCDTRTAQKFTEQAYRHGVVLCRCPGCKRWHLIADRLGYFEDPVDGGWDVQKFLHERKEFATIITDETQLMEFVTSAKGDEANS